MDLYCTIVGHHQSIEGVCINQKCTANLRVLCFECIQQFHSNCNLQYLSKTQFIEKLNDLRRNIEQNDTVSAIRHQLTNIEHLLIKQLSQLKELIQKLELENSKYIGKINDVLKSEVLSKEQWMIGYQLLADPYKIKIDDFNTIPKLLRQSQEFIEEFIETLNRLQERQQALSHWNKVSKEQPLIINGQGNLFSITISPDGKYIASGNGCEIKIWDPQNYNELVTQLQGHSDNIRSLKYSHCGSYLISGSDDTTINIWNTQGYKLQGQIIGHKSSVSSVIFSLDQKYIISASQDNTIRIWNFSNFQEIVSKRIQHTLSRWSKLSLCPIRNHFAFGDPEGKVTIFDFNNNKVYKTLLGHSKEVMALQYSQDGAFIISGSEDKSIRIWDAFALAGTQIVKSMKGHLSSIVAISISPDMKHFISGGIDKTLRVWNIEKHQQIGESIGHIHHVHAAEYTPKGQYLVSGDYRGCIRISMNPVYQ